VITQSAEAPMVAIVRSNLFGFNTSTTYSDVEVTSPAPISERYRFERTNPIIMRAARTDTGNTTFQVKSRFWSINGEVRSIMNKRYTRAAVVNLWRNTNAPRQQTSAATYRIWSQKFLCLGERDEKKRLLSELYQRVTANPFLPPERKLNRNVMSPGVGEIEYPDGVPEMPIDKIRPTHYEVIASGWIKGSPVERKIRAEFQIKGRKRVELLSWTDNYIPLEEWDPNQVIEGDEDI